MTIKVIYLAGSPREARVVRRHAKKVVVPEKGITRMLVTQSAHKAKKLLENVGQDQTIFVSDRYAWIGPKPITTEALREKAKVNGGYVVSHSKYPRSQSEEIDHYALFNPTTLRNPNAFYAHVLAPVVELIRRKQEVA